MDKCKCKLILRKISMATTLYQMHDTKPCSDQHQNDAIGDVSIKSQFHDNTISLLRNRNPYESVASCCIYNNVIVIQFSNMIRPGLSYLILGNFVTSATIKHCSSM